MSENQRSDLRHECPLHKDGAARSTPVNKLSANLASLHDAVVYAYRFSLGAEKLNQDSAIWAMVKAQVSNIDTIIKVPPPLPTQQGVTDTTKT